MPNYCANTLYITGPKVPEVLKAISAEDGRAIGFETIVPLTQPFGMKSGGMNDLAVLCATKPEDDLGEYAKYPWIARTGVKTQSDLCQWHGTTRQEMVKHGQWILDKFKYAGVAMLDHRSLMWDTRCNAIDPVLLEPSNDSEATITFWTTWSPPLPVIEALGQHFPDHDFRLVYEEEENEFRGVLEIKHGVVTTDEYQEEEG
jgi:Ferredoxin-like domain in Api92-like protein